MQEVADQLGLPFRPRSFPVRATAELPSSPWERITRATWSRPSTPRRRSSFQVLRALFTGRRPERAAAISTAAPVGERVEERLAGHARVEGAHRHREHAAARSDPEDLAPRLHIGGHLRRVGSSLVAKYTEASFEIAFAG